MAVERIDTDRCIGCELCFKTCYADVYRMDREKKKAVVKYPEECVLCCWCIALCPVDAIVFTETKTVPPMTSWG
ncbi:MAG: 4Fe-4S binding protein [Deltaproteobacteria bacterium]|nr:4Fe-4S binding protein [Deltaproteobacteria bacterium]